MNIVAKECGWISRAKLRALAGVNDCKLDNRVGCAERTRSGFCLRDFHKRNRASRSGRAGAAELHAPAARVKYRGAMDGGGEKISAVQSGGFDRRDNGRIIISDAGAIKPRRYRPGTQGRFSGASERGRAERTLKPAVEILRLEDHRHAVVKRLHPRARAAHDDRAGQDLIAARGIAPAIPQRRRSRERASRRRR